MNIHAMLADIDVYSKIMLHWGCDVLLKDEATGLEVRAKKVAGRLYFIPKDDSWSKHEQWVEAAEKKFKNSIAGQIKVYSN